MTCFTRLDGYKTRAHSSKHPSRGFLRAVWSTFPFLQVLVLIFGVTNQFSELSIVDQNWGKKNIDI